MKIEISAGGLIVRKNPQGWEIVLISDMNNQWTFPKGRVEKGEDTLTAARREIAEEVGLDELTLIKKLPIVRYTYKRNGLKSKIVHYFLFQTTSTKNLHPQHDEGIHDAQWISIEKALNILGYPHTNHPLLKSALKGEAFQG